MKHKLDKNQVRKLVVKIVGQNPGHVLFSKHALEEIANDNLTTVDIMNVMKSPDSRIVLEPEFENNSWRYRLETKRICVVIAINDPTFAVVVTAWRKKS